jgi:hypothetical protein
MYDKGNLGPWLESYAAGKCTFAEFRSNTLLDWRRLADRLRARWQGHGLDTDDVVQELLIACLKCLPRHDPSRAPLLRYVVFNTHAMAKRHIHRMRGVKRNENRDGAPDRIRSPCVVGFDDGDSSHGARDQAWRDYCAEYDSRGTGSEPAVWDGLLAWRKAVRLAPEHLRPVYRAIEATRGNIDDAVELLDADGHFRRVNRISSREGIRRVMQDALWFALAHLG